MLRAPLQQEGFNLKLGIPALPPIPSNIQLDQPQDCDFTSFLKPSSPKPLESPKRRVLKSQTKEAASIWTLATLPEHQPKKLLHI
jgi:hypothetical protein